MAVSEYKNNQCKYRIDKLADVVYLVSENALRNIHIDSGDAFVNYISEQPMSLSVYNIALSDTDELDERYKFTHQLTFSINGYANYNDFQGRYYAIVKTVDGVYWLVNPLFPCKVTFTYTLDGNGSHTDFTLSTVSNHPTLRLFGLDEATPYECGYQHCTFKSLRLNETSKSLKSGYRVLFTNDGFKDIVFDKNSASFTEQFDGKNVSHSINFNIKFDDYKSSWHYNLLEFVDNTYAAIVDTTCDRFITCGFGFGLNPSFTVSANGEMTPDNIQIQLTDLHDNGDFIGYDDRIYVNKDGATTWAYTSKYNGFECVGNFQARYLLKEELDALQNPTGRYMALDGYEGQFPNLDIVGTFDETETFFSYQCGDNCKFQSSFPLEFVFNTVSCRDYSVICDSDWTITSSAPHITLNRYSGEHDHPYVVQVCNDLQPTSTAVKSTLTITACEQEKTIDVIVKEGDDCLTAGAVFDISANGQYVVIPTACCVKAIEEDEGIITNIIIQETYIRVYVPQNDTSIPRQFILRLYYCDDNVGEVTINQDNGFERWLFEYFTCDNGKKCEVERRYTGTSASDINTWTTDTRLVNCVDSPDCSGIDTRWIDTTETTCNGGRKYIVQAEQMSTDGGATWTNTGAKRLGAETQDSPAECEGTEDEEKWEVEEGEYFCDGTTKYTLERLYTRPVGSEEWIMTDVTRKGETVLETDSVDCGYVIPSTAWTCDKWEVADGYICEDTTKYAREQRFVRNCDDCEECNEAWIATGVYRRTDTVLEIQSLDCGYIKGSEEYSCNEWRDVEGYICEGTTKYNKQRLYQSDCEDCSDCAAAMWYATDIYRRGETVLETDSSDCGYIIGSDEWACDKWELDDDYWICEDTTKYKTEQRYVRNCEDCENCNAEWVATGVYRRTNIVIETDSTDCGFYIPTTAWTCEKWVVLSGINDYICEETTKYAKEQRYVRNCEDCEDCEAEWVATSVFRRSSIVLDYNSEDCGYNPEIEGNCVKWEWDDDTICDGWNLYQYLHKYVRQCDDCEDCSALWIPTEIYKRGELVRANSLECGYIPADTYVRWEIEDTVCNGYDLYDYLRKYVSEDQVQWYATDIYKQGDLIEENSFSCGYIPTEWTACTQWRSAGYMCDGWNLYVRLRKYITEDCLTYYETAIFKRGDLVEEKSFDCGYVPTEIYTKWEADETICDGFDLYEYLVKYISDDNVKWFQTQIKKRGELIEANSFECGYIPSERCSRWELDGTLCNGYDLHNREIKLISDDCDTRWYKTQITRIGSLIKANSEDCGYKPSIEYEYRWVATTATTCYRYDLVYQYKKQRRRLFFLAAQWEDVIPTEYSVDGAGTLPIRYAAKDTPDCGWAPATEPIYEWRDIDPSIDWICDDCEEPIYRLELATDEWICDECPEPEPPEEQYRWVDSGTTCVGVDKWQQKVKQVSLDSGVTWANVVPEQLSATSIIQANSVQCGYVPEVPFKYIAENTQGFVSSAACDSNTELKGTRQECWVDGHLIGYTDFPLFNSAVRAVTIGDCVTRLGYYSFVGNTSISTIHIPSGVTSVGGAFMRCTNLSSVTFDNAGGDMSHFGGFSGCTSLTEIDIPRTVISSNDKFDGCTNLERIIFRGGLYDARELTFSGCSENMELIIWNNNGRGWGLPTINGAGEFAGVNRITVYVDAADYEFAHYILWERPVTNWYRYRYITSLICDGCNNS